MKVEISRCLERLWVRVEDSLGDEVIMLLKPHELHELEWAIHKYLEEQPIKTAKEVRGR